MSGTVIVFLGVCGAILMFALLIPLYRINFRFMTAVAIIVVTMVGSLTLYAVRGSPLLINSDLLFSEQQVFDQQFTALSKEDVDTVVDTLYDMVQERLSDHAKIVSVWRQLVILNILREDYDHAIELAKGAIDLFPSDTELMYLMVRALQNKSDGLLNDESRGYLQQIVDLKPSDVRARWLTGMAAIQDSSFDKAEQIFRELLADAKSPEERQKIRKHIERILTQEQ